MATGPVQPIVSLSEAQAYARIETGEEEAILAGLIRSASGLCEAFLRQVVIRRPFAETVAASPRWQRLAISPVMSIEAASVAGTPLPADSFASDIDSSGRGWARVIDSSVSGTIEISGTAGMAATENDVPEPIRQGVIRLVTHLFSSRDELAGEIPAAVTALWRPYRRLGLS